MKRNLKIAGVLCIILALCLMVGCAETGIFRFIEVIDSLLRSGDKDAVLAVIDQISGTSGNDTVGEVDSGETPEPPTLEEYAKN